MVNGADRSQGYWFESNRGSLRGADLHVPPVVDCWGGSRRWIRDGWERAPGPRAAAGRGLLRPHPHVIMGGWPPQRTRGRRTAGVCRRAGTPVGDTRLRATGVHATTRDLEGADMTIGS